MAIHSRVTAAGLQAEAAAKVAGTQLRIAKIRFGSGHTVPTASTTGITTPLAPPQETSVLNFAPAVGGAYELGAEVHGSAEFTASEMELVLSDDTIYAVIVDDVGDLMGKNTTQIPVLLIKLQFTNPADASTLVATVSSSNALLSATETTRGAVALATRAEAVAGAEDTKAMTAAKTDAAIAANAKLPVRRIYTANAVWNKPAGLAWLEVEAWGGGAGADSRRGEGGGGGAYAFVRIDAAALGATEQITVGAGGTPAATPGGDTTFGAHLTARGGQRDIRGQVRNRNFEGGGLSGAGGSSASTAWGGGDGSVSGGGSQDATYGGGGGGSNINVRRRGGVSLYGGNGGTGGIGAGADGAIPGGGGGAGRTSAANGARGEVRLIEYYT